MFLTNKTRGYTRDGQQYASGLFLMVVGGATFMTDHDDLKLHMVQMPLRAAVRFVRLSQCGHWMMGGARFGKKRVTVSGAYGSDGLPMDVDKLWDEYQRMIPLPVELAREFWRGGGHNSVGDEADSMRKWAMAHLTELRKAG